MSAPFYAVCIRWFELISAVAPKKNQLTRRLFVNLSLYNVSPKSYFERTHYPFHLSRAQVAATQLLEKKQLRNKGGKCEGAVYVTEWFK